MAQGRSPDDDMRDATKDMLERLLRGELSAIETYEQALRRSSRAEKMGRLTAIRNHHADAAELLRDLLARFDARADVSSSGTWGAFAKATESVATIIGEHAALRALKAGEDHGIKLYEKALAEEQLQPEVRELIRTKLLPKTRAHVGVLDELLAD